MGSMDGDRSVCSHSNGQSRLYYPVFTHQLKLLPSIKLEFLANFAGRVPFQLPEEGDIVRVLFHNDQVEQNVDKLL